MPDLVAGAGNVKEARQENLSPSHRSPDVLPRLHQVVCDTPPSSETGLTRRKHFLGSTEILQLALDHPLVHFPQMRREGDGPVAGDLLPCFMDGHNDSVFPLSRNRTPVPAPLEEAEAPPSASGTRRCPPQWTLSLSWSRLAPVSAQCRSKGS